MRVEAQFREQHLTIHFMGSNKRTVFTPNRVTVESEEGRLLESWGNPRSSCAGQAFDTPWDDIHDACFTSYALWTYLTVPFLYTHLGFAVQELETWRESGEVCGLCGRIFPSLFRVTHNLRCLISAPTGCFDDTNTRWT